MAVRTSTDSQVAFAQARQQYTNLPEVLALLGPTEVGKERESIGLLYKGEQLVIVHPNCETSFVVQDARRPKPNTLALDSVKFDPQSIQTIDDLTQILDRFVLSPEAQAKPNARAGQEALARAV